MIIMKFNKDYNSKIILLLVTVMFLLSSSVYGIDLSDDKIYLRVPLVSGDLGRDIDKRSLYILEDRAINELVEKIFDYPELKLEHFNYEQIGSLFHRNTWYIAVHNIDSKAYYENLKRWCSEFLRSYLTARAQKRNLSLIDYIYIDCLQDGEEMRKIFRDMKYAIIDSAFSLPFITGLFKGCRDYLRVLEAYFDNLIEEKVGRADFRIHVYSLGCASGEEPYSIAAVLYARLLKYAYKQGMPKSEAEAWIKNRWDVVIDSGDVCLVRLGIIKSGLVRMAEYDKNRWEESIAFPHYRKFFKFHKRTKWGQYDYLVDKRIQAWVKPFYIDLVDKTAETMLAQDKAEVVFAVWLTGREVYDMRKILRIATNPKYKSLCVHGSAWEAKTNGLAVEIFKSETNANGFQIGIPYNSCRNAV